MSNLIFKENHKFLNICPNYLIQIKDTKGQAYSRLRIAIQLNLVKNLELK